MIVLTQGVAMLEMLKETASDEIITAVKSFTAFEDGDDSYTERDFFAFDYFGQKLFAKFDYNKDSKATWGTDYPEDTARSYRVLTVMLASEY